MNQTLIKQIVEDKKNGYSDELIGKKYGVNLKLIEEAITKQIGVNVSNLNHKKKKVIQLEPKNFQPEKTTVWSFKSRGNWATHNGNYRGNWSPYIPRNIILKFSKENDLVLDYFCGAGTTAVESKLLHRNFIGIDINPQAKKLAEDNVNFESGNGSFPQSIKLKVGDARNLSDISDKSIDLICAHPPYADIVRYTHDNENDLSSKNVQEFLLEMEKVAKESYRVLKDRQPCAILIGDMRKNKNVIPLGFWTIEKFLKAGFQIKELIIKRQHNCKTTGFWYNNSVKFNFLLLAHEYLVVFKKTDMPEAKNGQKKEVLPKIIIDDDVYLESTTAWIFQKDNWLNKTMSNLIKRYSSKNHLLYKNDLKAKGNQDLIINFGTDIDDCIDFSKGHLKNDGILAFICEDKRIKDDLVNSLSLVIEKKLRNNEILKIKELVVVSVENGESKDNENLKITHKYILIYKKA